MIKVRVGQHHRGGWVVRQQVLTDIPRAGLLTRVFNE